MSTDAHGTAPVWAGAVLVGSTLGARPCAAVTLRRLVAVVRAIAGLPLLCVRRCIATKDYFTHFAPPLGPMARPTLQHAGRACWPPSWPAQEAPPVVARLDSVPILRLDHARRSATEGVLFVTVHGLTDLAHVCPLLRALPPMASHAVAALGCRLVPRLTRVAQASHPPAGGGGRDATSWGPRHPRPCATRLFGGVKSRRRAAS